jgi:hypothetical protein
LLKQPKDSIRHPGKKAEVGITLWSHVVIQRYCEEKGELRKGNDNTKINVRLSTCSVEIIFNLTANKAFCSGEARCNATTANQVHFPS